MSEPSTVKQALATLRTLQARLDAREAARSEPIAIIGMGCRYPGAPDLEAFWSLLVQGRDAVSETPRERWDAEALFNGSAAAPGTLVTRRGGFVDVERFDPAFFGISPREAPHVDPRQRLMLESTWEALEHAGIPPHTLAGTRTGVFVATLTNDYDHLLFSELARVDAYSGAGTANSVVANRLSYVLDLRGPSLALDTACSGSLVALHLACESLRAGESTAAIVGGVSVNLMPKSSVFFSRAGALSPSGRCATFDRAADGMVRSDGAGVVVLKPLGRALADGDRVIALIAGSAVNHDGRSSGIMAPNGQAQAAALAEAYGRARIDPAQVQYIETHGTGTKIGDPIEVHALGEVLATGRAADRACVLGALKPNIGHTEAAAGVAGVIKAALAIERRTLPPTIHFETPNPLLELERLPFEIRTAAGGWPSPSDRLVAGVSSFGFGGTNAHVVLTEPPPVVPVAPIAPPYVLPLSARAPEALVELARATAALLRSGEAEVADICRTAATGRTHHAWRLAVTGTTAEELATALERRAAERVPEPAATPRVAFVFSGQGSHWPRMGRDLYAREPIFGETLDRCDRAIAALAGRSIIEEIARPELESRLNDTELAQPAIFAVQVALAALWRSWGITPGVVAGHSLGEVAAACAAGSLTIEDGARIVCARSALMKRVAGRGATAVIGLGADETRLAIAAHDPRVTVAGSNGPQTTVVAGDADAVTSVTQELERQGVFARAVAGVDIAFHSPHMDALRDELTAALAEISPKTGSIPQISTVTADVIDGCALDAAYWSRNLREPFLFTQAMRQLLARGCNTFIEVAPHAVLGSAMTQTIRHADAPLAHVFPSLRRDTAGPAVMYATLASLYEAGVAIDWVAVCHGRGRVVTLPSYPWQRQRYWFDQLGSAPRVQPAMPRSGGHPLLGLRVDVAGTARGGLHVWQTALNTQTAAWVGDHRVDGGVVWPGAATIEMARASAADVWPGVAVEIADVRFERILRLPDDGTVELQTVVEGSDDARAFRLFSRPAAAPGAAWRLHASATLRRSGAPPVDKGLSLSALHAACHSRLDVEQFYSSLAATGLNYGPGFRVVSDVYAGYAQSLAHLHLRTPVDGCWLNPTVLDGAFQAVAAAIGGSDVAAHAYLPEGVEHVSVRAPGASTSWAYVALRGRAGDERIVADIVLLDDRGSVSAELTGFAVRRRGEHRRVADVLADEWVDVPATPGVDHVHERYLLIADTAGVADELARELIARGHAAELAHPNDVERALSAPGERTGVVYLAPLGHAVAGPEAASHVAFGAAAVAQAMARRGSPARLWLVTHNAVGVESGTVSVAQAGVGGVALVVDQEHPELSCTHVDIDDTSPDAAVSALLAELQTADAERVVAWRRGRRMAARLAQAPDMLRDPSPVRGDATYLVTGGLGALGLVTAKALVQLGAKHLLLVSRRDLSSGGAEAEHTVAALRASGVTVQTLAADVCAPSIAAELDAALCSRPPLAGVVHAAGVLADAPLLQQDSTSFHAVFGPKVSGAWNLHLCTRDRALDFFVCYSSAASMIGSPGQANYAAANAVLDAIAAHRRASGLPAVSVNWGPWASSGMAANDRTRARLASRGMSALSEAAGAEMVARLLQPAGASRVGIIAADWPAFVRQFPAGAPPLFAWLAPEQTHSEGDTAAVVVTERASGAGSLPDIVRAELAAVLGFADPGSIGPRDRFFDIGMDSLTAVEFRNRLAARLGLPLAATLAFDFGSTDLLVDYLAVLMAPPAEAVCAPACCEAAHVDEMSDDELVAALARELDGDPA